MVFGFSLATAGVAEARCGNGKCNGKESCDTCPADCGTCPVDPVCGDGVCEGDEDVNTCAADCGECGDGVCTAGLGEDCSSCSADCGTCSTCGDGTCDVDEDCSTCSADCGSCSTCGDGTCDAGEDCSTCSADCGSCSTCGDGTCDAGEDCSSCSADCGTCPPVCGDGTCEVGEDCSSCEADCGTCPPVCGDGTCEGGEDCSTCEADCGTCSTCGDGTCDAGEDCSSCSADCTCASTPTKLSGIGNSIMQAYNAASSSSPLDGDTPQVSFARGTDAVPYSLYQRYVDDSGLSGGMQFVSVSGAEFVGGSDNAAAQASAICAQSVKPDRVVVLLGGNDVCNRGSGLSDPMARVAAMYTDEQMGNAVTAALDQLGQCLPPDSRVHVLGIPRVDGLFDVGISQGCQSRWDNYLIFFSTNICRIVTGGSLGTGNSTQEARDAVGARIDGYNEEIAARVAVAQSAYAVDFTTDWVGSMAQGMVNTSVGAYQFQTGDLSNADCFHPYYNTGHVKLACASWESWEGDPANVPACLQ